VNLTGTSTGSVIADASGNYIFTGLLTGSYTVTPSKSGFTFTPASQNVTVNTANVTAVNFSSAAVTTFSISGTISGAGGNAATVNLTGTSSATVTADASGNYTFSGLANGSYTVSPTKTGFTFSPASQSVTVSNADVTRVNFSTNTGGSVQNSQAISVNSGPTGQYVNGVFADVTVCVPGTSNCQTISNVLVDTGSSGLRILNTAIQLTLPAQNATNGNSLVECAQFADGFTWGPVKLADVKLAGESASNVPIQIIDPTTFTIPTACSNTGTPENTLSTLLANGILGVGNFRQDCGPGCVTPGFHFYFACSSSSTCPETGATLTQQVQNPVWMFSGDNNGVVIQLPQVPASGAPSASGSLIFGIGTQSNNALGSATILTLAGNGTFSTTFNSTTFSNSVMDSGSNGIFFLDSATTGIPDCPGGNSGFYCPTATQNLSATNRGANAATTVVNFSVANAQTLFSNINNNAFNNLAGSNPGSFDWGLPFFFGRTVFTAIEGQSTPGGTGPYLAY
jgi:hypothetical protein